MAAIQNRQLPLTPLGLGTGREKNESMIQANELRIGNWVNSPNGKPIKVESMDETGINLNISYGEYGDTDYDGRFDDSSIFGRGYIIQPIPLTPEILQKCGFVETDEPKNSYSFNNGCSFYEHYEGYFIISLKDGVYRKFWEVDEDVYYSWHGTEVKYLHQLQNLFYALRNQELTYTP